jgi:hypothetical protein
MSVMTRAESRQEAHFEANHQPLSCCVCHQYTRGLRQVTPCANVDCENSICNECQGVGTIAASLGTCDHEECAVIALSDLRAMFTNAVRRAERRAA